MKRKEEMNYHFQNLNSAKATEIPLRIFLDKKNVLRIASQKHIL